MGIFFEPTATASDLAAVRSVVSADHEVGLVGYIDQAAGYQEFQTIFRGTDAENSLPPRDVPPSLRVFLGLADSSGLQAQVNGMAGVLNVAVSALGQPSATPELNPIDGLYDLGTVVYEQPAWTNSCVLRPWGLNHPEVL